MKVSYNWLKEFVDVAASPGEVASRLALSGTNIASIETGTHGAVIDAEITSNRPDCLGMLGIAREVGAVYRLPLKINSPKPPESKTAGASEAVKVRIEAQDLCGRFTARGIRGVKIQPSPKWLKDRLEASGVASINNVVDVTNYVMLELGHALHAFDYDKVRDHRIIVRRAKPGEKMRTLDGIERTLDPGICVISDGDGSRAAGIGGIMGGAETEISFSTKNVLIECAWFEPIAIRRAARFLKLHTEASTRFGRGADPEMADLASRRGAEGSLLAAWECTQPSWRAEVEREIDLIEEIARIYGLDKFPPRLPAARQGAARLAYYEAESLLRERLIGLGYREILTIPHVAEERDALFRPEGIAPARLSNPLSEEASVLRSTGIVTMAAALEWNLNHGQRNARLFEIGSHYRLHGFESVETRVLTIGATGEAREKGLYDSAREYSFADLKGDLDAIGELASGLRWEESSTSWLHAARRASIHLNTVNSNEAKHLSHLGVAGQLARRVAERLKLRQDVFLAELALEPFYKSTHLAKAARRYEPLSRFPAVERDFSLLLTEGTRFSDVTKTIQSLGISAIASIEATDLFRGKNVPAGKYSLLVRVTFQSRDATLTEAQISDYSGKIIAALEKNLGAQLRANWTLVATRSACPADFLP